MDKLSDILNELDEVERARYYYTPDAVESCIWVSEYNSEDELIGKFKLNIKMEQVPNEI